VQESRWAKGRNALDRDSYLFNGHQSQLEMRFAREQTVSTGVNWGEMQLFGTFGLIVDIVAALAAFLGVLLGGREIFKWSNTSYQSAVAKKAQQLLADREFDFDDLNAAKPRADYDADLATGLKQIISTCTGPSLSFVCYFNQNNEDVAYYHDSRLTEDVLKRFWEITGLEYPKDIYKDFTKNIPTLIDSLNDHVKPIGQGSLLRTILDVEHGGVIYIRLNDNQFLVGICLDQKNMVRADSEMRFIGGIIQDYLGLNTTWPVPGRSKKRVDSNSETSVS